MVNRDWGEVYVDMYNIAISLGITYLLRLAHLVGLQKSSTLF